MDAQFIGRFNKDELSDLDAFLAVIFKDDLFKARGADLLNARVNGSLQEDGVFYGVLWRWDVSTADKAEQEGAAQQQAQECAARRSV